MLANVNGAWAKRRSIEGICAQDEPDIIFLTETKTNIRYPEPKGYRYTNNPRLHSKTSGGGIAVLIRNDLVNSIDMSHEHDFDNLFVIRVKNSGRDIVFFIVYAPCDNMAAIHRK